MKGSFKGDKGSSHYNFKGKEEMSIDINRGRDQEEQRGLWSKTKRSLGERREQTREDQDKCRHLI